MTYAFKFISGKYQGGEFPIPEAGELLIGRASDLDLVIVEDMVSRKHAKVVAAGASLSITDLGSTNGTFVNGEKVRRAELKIGDRVLVGTSILKIVDAGELSFAPGEKDAATVNAELQEIANRAPETSTMSGDLVDVPLPDLLQLFATNRKSGVLSITGAHRGKIYIKQGHIQYAVIGGEPPMRPMKAMCRMMSWQEGSFQLDPYDDGVEFPEVFEESTESILIEALRQTDEIKKALGDLPPLESAIKLCVPLAPKLSGLSAGELDTLQLAVNFGTLKAVIDKTVNSDHEAIVNLAKLLRDGYLEAE